MQCPKCGHEPTLKEVQASPDDCPQCGVNYTKFQQIKEREAEEAAQQRAVAASLKKVSPVVRTVMHDYPGAQPVVVVDLKMSFWSMVVFMVKWAIAAIPAFLILIVLGVALTSFVSGFFSSYSKYSQKKHTDGESQLSLLSDPAPEQIYTPDPTRGDFWLLSLEQIGSYTVANVRTDSPDGEKLYSEFSVDCSSGRGAITKAGYSVASMRLPSPREPYASIDPGSPRFYIAKRMCRERPDRNRVFN